MDHDVLVLMWIVGTLETKQADVFNTLTENNKPDATLLFQDYTTKTERHLVVQKMSNALRVTQAGNNTSPLVEKERLRITSRCMPRMSEYSKYMYALIRCHIVDDGLAPLADFFFNGGWYFYWG